MDSPSDSLHPSVAVAGGQPAEPLRALCGMRCDLCPAYERNRGEADLAKASQIWAELFDVHLEPAAIACGGCRGDAAQLLDRECPVRPCVLGRGLQDCGECPEMPCERLRRRWVSRAEIEARLGRAIPEDDFRRYVLPFENAPYLVERSRGGHSAARPAAAEPEP